MMQYLFFGTYSYPAISDVRPPTVLSPRSCLLREGATQGKKPQFSTSARRIISELNLPRAGLNRYLGL